MADNFENAYLIVLMARMKGPPGAKACSPVPSFTPSASGAPVRMTERSW